MAERYSRLFTLESALYASGAPVMVAAGALLKDSYSTHLMAQLKYIHVGTEPIRSIKVSLTMSNAAGQELPKPLEYQYQDLNVKANAEFGRNVAIILPNDDVRSFRVAVTEVQYDNGSSWTAPEDLQWIPVQKRQLLEEALGDKETAVQYQVRYGNDCKYAPAELDVGLWYCTCGAVNKSADSKCHSCRRALSALKAVNVDDLRQECQGRLKVEEEQAAADKAEAQVKNKKRLRIAAVLVPLFVIAVLVAAIVPQQMAVRRNYNDAIALLEARQFDQAIDAFTALGQYKDSPQQAQYNVPYQRAMYIVSLAQAGNADSLSFIGKTAEDMDTEIYGDNGAAALLYQAAIEALTSLGNYRDCDQQIQLCRDALEGLYDEKLQVEYDAALEQLKAGNYLSARDAFLALGEFEDSADMAAEALYQKAVALYEFTEKYKVRYIYASISTEADKPSVFCISRARALEIGTSVIGDLSAACGGDDSNVSIEETPAAELKPMLESLSALFKSLGDYKDSAEYVKKLEEAGDYTRPFYQLCEAGDVQGAYDWLTAYDEEFEERDRWLELLEFYMPFCSDWALYAGDYTLIPMSVGYETPCHAFNTSVVVSLEKITLYITPINTDEEYTVELTAEPGKDIFVYDGDQYARYYANISTAGRLAYMKYYITGDGEMVGSCEYSRS